MAAARSDALVFFGATGDLAYKKIFPALQALVKRGHLNVPVIGVAKSNWTLDSSATGPATASKSTAASTGGVRQAEQACCATSTAITTTPATFQELRKQMGDAKQPTFYLAIPPVLFGPSSSNWASRAVPTTAA